MFEQINNDLTAALKSGDKFKLSVLRMLKSEIKNAEINKKDSLTDDETISIIKKQVKVRKDSKNEYEKYNREDLVADLNKEIEILNIYLPEEMTEEELTKIIDEVITETGATDIKSMGMVIKAVSLKCGAAADMSIVSKIVKEKLDNH